MDPKIENKISADFEENRFNRLSSPIRGQIRHYVETIFHQEEEIKKLRNELYGTQNENTNTRIEQRAPNVGEIQLPNYSCVNFYPSPMEYLNYIQCRQHEMRNVLDVRGISGTLFIKPMSGNHIEITMRGL